MTHRVCDLLERATFVTGRASSFVHRDAPTENVHIAFTAPDQPTVAALHETAVAAGRDDGVLANERTTTRGTRGAYVRLG